MGAHVDARGCPTDADQDGVHDGIDQCPGTPASAKVDAKGCPTDADADGHPRRVDQCPNTPAGAVVDATGCPVDTDKDGVPDGLDKCPNTSPAPKWILPAARSARIATATASTNSKDKCPVRPRDPGRRERLPHPVHPRSARRSFCAAWTFETGKSALKPESYTVLDIVAGSLIGNPDIRIEVAGYTDNTGTAASKHPAVAGAGRSGSRVPGEQGRCAGAHDRPGLRTFQPGRTNTNAAGRAQNRRVELHQLPVRERSLPMHRFRHVGAALALGVAPLAAQRTHSYEFSAFGAWTKYDKAFNLANRVGGAPASATSSARSSGSRPTSCCAGLPGRGQRHDRAGPSARPA